MVRSSDRQIRRLFFSLLALAFAIFACATQVVCQAAGNVERFVGPTAKTTRLHAVEGSAALLEGEINPHGRYTVWRFQWGATSDYGHLAFKYAPEEGWSDNSPHGVEEPIECLAPHTVYHYRVIAYSHGVKAFGRDRTFRTRGLRLPRSAAYRYCPGHSPVA